MKKIFLSICFMIVSVFAFAQWTLLNPKTTNYNLTSVYFADANTGYAVGDSGIILKTTDGGINWSKLHTGTIDQLNSVYFTDVNTGYAVGGDMDFSDDNNGTILKTTDGGITWNTISSDTLPYLRSVFFIDHNTGYAGGYRLTGWAGQGWRGYGVILKTTDGGTSWTESSGNYEAINSIYFTNTLTGYAVGFGLVGSAAKKSWMLFSKTITGGLTWDETIVWTTNTSRDNSLNSIYFPHADTGYASGPKSVFKTTDAGVNWTQVLSLSETDIELSSAYFYDGNTGYAVGENGTILITINGGTTWDAQSSGTTNRLSSVCFTDVNTGYIVGNAGTILKTSDGGATWTTLLSTISNINCTSFISVYFTDSDIGYAIGRRGVGGQGAEGALFKTIDSGATWSDLSFGDNYSLYSVFFTDANTGYFVGEYTYDGTMLPSRLNIIKTVNAGLTWTGTTIISNTTKSDALNSIYFPDANTGYAVGRKGCIVKTSDGGATWSELSSGTTADLNSVFFTDANTGYAVGGTFSNSGIILKTINGGISWENFSTHNLSSIYFPDANTGYAVGGYTLYFEGGGHSDHQIIIKTNNSGSTWTDLSSGTDTPLSAVYFTDANSGYVVGEDGTILKTTDGGTTWTAQSSGTSNTLNSIYFADANTGYVVGEHGTILKTTNGGGFVSLNEPVSSESTFTLFPNPATNKITISTNKTLPRETRISITCISGQQLIQARFQNQKQFDMDVITLRKGIYLVKIQTNTGIETKKLVIQ